MTVETWTAFCAASILVTALPSPLASLVARYATQRGRHTAFVTVPAIALGLGVALTVAVLLLLAIAWAAPSLLEPLSWLGLAYLMLYALWSFQEPSIRCQVADNDNLPEQRAVRIFGRLVASCLSDLRYVAVLGALLAQFPLPVLKAPAILLEMQAAFVLLAAVGALKHVAFPQRTLRRSRHGIRSRPASHKMGTRFIARRAVTAGYRRIAA
ncbi:threonine/homoserine/homoserine lactone efflux protein [Pseudorhizobium tarimense]|uniref:Threonine/homoserine/homoserine lactone efflux protein n=1 Tax=Pseudorhizobium tarimense TaxID=1079109 RepID=A0ABV2H3M1_9HYPH|nr:hypothetical protein [Pseudorhizobium tarimense]MCJ8518434.1 hypothetical protein [Pseudorhizobium tarimense]